MKSKTSAWIALALLVVPMFASYFFDDMFSSVSQLFSHPELLELGWDSADYGFYAGGYSFLCVWGGLIFCGMLLDKWGVRVTGSIFVGMMALGAAMVTGAISAGLAPKVSLTVAYIGCMLFGLGSEIAGVAVTRSIAKWFKDGPMALAMGLQLAIARLGTAAALLLSPVLIAGHAPGEIYTLSQTNRPALVGLSLLLLGGVLWAVFVAMDARFDRAMGRKEASCGETEKAEGVPSDVEAIESQDTAKEADKDDKFRFSDIFKILGNRRFVMIALLCVFFYCCIISFKKFATSILIPRFGIPAESASVMVSMIPFFTVVFAPLFGLLVDKVGKGPRWMISGAVLVLIAHLMIAFAPASITLGGETVSCSFLGYIAIGILGVGYSLLPAAMWPTVPKIVPEKNLGTAYSLIYWIQNIGLMTVPVVVGGIFKRSSGLAAAMSSEYIFISLAAVAILISVLFALSEKNRAA